MASFEQGRAALRSPRNSRLVPREIESALVPEIPVERFRGGDISTGAIVANAIMSVLAGHRERQRTKLAAEQYRRSSEEHDLRMEALKRSTERVPVSIDGETYNVSPDAMLRYQGSQKPRPVANVPIGKDLQASLGTSESEMDPRALASLTTMKRPRGSGAGAGINERLQNTAAYRALQARAEQEVTRLMSAHHTQLNEYRRDLMGSDKARRQRAEMELGLKSGYNAADINVAQQLYLSDAEARSKNAVLGTMSPLFRELEARLMGAGKTNTGAGTSDTPTGAPESDPYDELLRLIEGEDEDNP